MGANPTPMAWGEVITSLSQGQINALGHSLGVFNDFNLHEIAPHVTLTNHASSPFPIICSREWIESLDPADREVLVKCVKEVAKNQRAEEYAKEQEYLARFKDEGAEVYELTADEIKAFEEAVQSVYDYQRKIVGDEMLEKWLKTRP
jgi:TRAP-type C4-dicarboxylate transport system substrate-binding protein